MGQSLEMWVYCRSSMKVQVPAVEWAEGTVKSNLFVLTSSYACSFQNTLIPSIPYYFHHYSGCLLIVAMFHRSKSQGTQRILGASVKIICTITSETMIQTPGIKSHVTFLYCCKYPDDLGFLTQYIPLLLHPRIPRN